MQNGASSELFEASMSAYQEAIEHFGRVLHMLMASGTSGENGTAGLQALQQQLVKELESWLSASHPLTGWMSAALRQGAPGMNIIGASPLFWPAQAAFGVDRAFDAGTASPQAQIAPWIQLQSQLAAHWNTIAQNAGRSFTRRAGAMTSVAHLTDVRKLYGLWIECAEEAYAQTASSDEFSRLLSELINIGMTLRLQGQQQLQKWAGAAGLPTRAELEALQRQVAELASRNSRLRKRSTSNPTRRPAKRATGKSSPGQSQSGGERARPHKAKATSRSKATGMRTSRSPAKHERPKRSQARAGRSR